ncbi:CaiB/BaiF CoA transferase family protein [Canibacter oris]|uniref:Crotonobetainyl-CoA:carnitine CoA-transferase CaiB-like acyl-CoA transferase n=1 Tax=Canibacter oris TaxID=1365628 RepID=A0A840DNZ3_9MICO|nr:CaiB/BaiF CoA-transferase family protein [Canibacter oris]MBB4071807.1 crotonobetainyl-CoA:carnitine CoA-transferase CaiB-like acyl-CoA transferase [Canibacter oris]
MESKANQQGAAGALQGIRVADFSRVLAGPYATMLLADFGADVIKIESPDGDGTRAWVPPVNAAGQSTYFVSANRGKRSIALDLRNPQDLERAKELAATADVVIENFKPGTMAKFGLDYDTVAALNPGVVYASISGFGDKEGAALPGYDLLVQAVGGLMSITGSPDSEPSKVGVALVDIITGLNAVIGIQAALRARDTAGSSCYGKGQHVKISLLGSLLGALANQASSTLETGLSPKRLGNAHPSIAPYETFTVNGESLAVAIGTDGQFARFAELLGVPEMGSDPKFQTNEARVANRRELRETIERQLQTAPINEWVAGCARLTIPAGKVNSVGEAIAYAAELGLNPVVSHSVVTAQGEQAIVKTVANPISLDKTPATYHLAPPFLAQHQGADWLPRPAAATDAGAGGAAADAAAAAASDSAAADSVASAAAAESAAARDLGSAQQ